jgi:hypothetical protein
VYPLSENALGASFKQENRMQEDWMSFKEVHGREDSK